MEKIRFKSYLKKCKKSVDYKGECMGMGLTEFGMWDFSTVALPWNYCNV